MLSRLGSFTSRFLLADLHGFDFDAFGHFPQMVRVARKSHQAFGEKIISFSRETFFLLSSFTLFPPREFHFDLN